MKKTIKTILIAFVVLLMAALTFGMMPYAHAQTAPSKTLKIGIMVSVTGMMAGGYRDIFLAVKPTEKFLNDKGGVTIDGQKYRIDLVTYDDQSSPPSAVAAANKVMQDGVKFVFAPLFMPSNLAIAAVTEPAKILRVQASTAGAEQYGPKNRYLFCTDLSIYNVPAIYDYLTKMYPKVKKIARLLPDDPGSRIFTEHDVREAQKRGIEIVFDEPFKIGVEDFYPLLTKALQTKPDAIDMGFSILPWARGLITQARELGFDGPIYAPNFVGDINLLAGLLDGKSGHDFFQGAPDVHSPKMTPLVKDFGKALEKELGVRFNMDHAMVLQAMWPLLRAIEKAQSFDTTKVVDTWENMKSIDSLYGPARMGGEKIVGINHIVMKPVLISRIVAKDKPIEFGYYEARD
jgi:branched-chain amino acid transport system substrate-binding protein